MIKARGYNCTIRLDGNRVVLTRSKMARAAGLPGEKVFVIDRISSITLKEAGIFTPGYIRFSVIGEDSRKSYGLVSQDPNAVEFFLKQGPEFGQLKAIVEGKMAGEETAELEEDAHAAQEVQSGEKEVPVWSPMNLTKKQLALAIGFGVILSVGAIASLEDQDRKAGQQQEAGSTGERAVAVDPDSGERTAVARSSHESGGDANQWYEGGTLSRSTMAEWRRASYRNRLATASDFLAQLWIDGELNAAVNSMEDLKPLAVELEKQISIAASGGTQADSQVVSTISSGCIILMHLKK